MSSELIGGTPATRTKPREYGRARQNPVRRYGGIVAVLLLHVFLILALINGLANKVVQIVQKPIETRIIEPVKPPPPPPLPVVKLPPPKLAPPPRPKPFVPPPEVAVKAPPTPAPTISHQDTPAPVVTPAPPAPPAAPAPVAPSKPVSHAVGVVCPNSDDVRRSMGYPQEAQDNNIAGDVTISFVVDPQGHVTDEKVDKSADPVLDRAAFVAVKKFHCISQGEPVRVQVPFSFNLN